MPITFEEYKKQIGAPTATPDKPVADLGKQFKRPAPLTFQDVKDSYTAGETIASMPRAFMYGAERALEQTADFVAMGTQGAVSDKAAKLRDFFKQVADEQLADAPGFVFDQFSEHPIAKTAWNVSAALPQLGSAYLITRATKKPILGASIFGPPTYAGFYREARDRGVPHEKAQALAFLDAVGQVGLEVIPLSGFMAGGTLLRRVMRGVWQEGVVEEGTQQIWENMLRVNGWGDSKNLARDLTDGVVESIIAGGIMGAGFGAVSQPTIEDMKADAFRNVREKLIKQGKAEGKSPQQIQATVEQAKIKVEELLKFKGLKQILSTLEKGVQENKDILMKGMIESTGGFGPATIETINVKNILPSDISKQAEELGVNMFGPDKWNDFPTVLQDIVTGTIGNLLIANVPADSIPTEATKIFENNKTFAPENIYLTGAGKKGQVFRDIEVYSPVFMVTDPTTKKPTGRMPLETLITRLKTMTVPKDINGVIYQVKQSVPPTDWKVHFAYPQEFVAQKKLTRKAWRVGRSIYNGIAEPEILPPEKATANAVTEVVQQFKAEKEAIPKVVREALKPFHESRFPEGKITKRYPEAPPTVTEPTAIQKAEARLTPKERELLREEELKKLSEAEQQERYDRLMNLQQYFKTKGIPESVRVIPPDPTQVVKDVAAEQAGEKPPVIRVPPKTPNQIIVEAIADPTVHLTEEEYYHLIRHVNMQMEQATPEERVALGEQLTALETQLRAKYPPTETQEMVGEVTGGTYDTETTGDAVMFENTTEGSEPNDVAPKGVDVRDFTFSAHVTSPQMELIHQLFLLKQDWQRQLELLGPKRKFGKYGKVTFEFVTRSLQEAKQAGEKYNKEMADIINRTFEKEYQSLMEQMFKNIPKNVVEKVNVYNLDELAQYINRGGIVSDADVEMVRREVNSQAKKGELIYGMVAIKPVQLVVESGMDKRVNKKYESGDVATLLGNYLYRIEDRKIYLRDDVEIVITAKSFADLLTRIGEQREAGQRPDVEWILPSQDYLFQGSLSKANFSEDDIRHATSDYKRIGSMEANDGKQSPDIEIDPNRQRSMPVRKAISIMKFLTTPSAIMRYFEKFVGERAILRAETKERLAKLKLDNELITPLMEDKGMQTLIMRIAEDQIRPLYLKVWEVSGQIARIPFFEKKYGTGRPAQQVINQQVRRLMFLANEEIFSRQGTPNLFSYTDLGNGGILLNSWRKETPEAEKVAYMKEMTQLRDFFNIAYSAADVQRWKTHRDKASFFGLLGQLPNGKALQSVLVYQKAEIEYPLLKSQLDAGVYKGANMWNNISRGYSHRVFTFMGAEKERAWEGTRWQNIRSTDTPSADYRTGAEFIMQTEAAGLKPVADWSTSSIDYIRQSMSLLQQQNLLNHLKVKSANIIKTIPGFEKNNVVNDIIAGLKLVEYETSPLIRRLVKETKLRATDILSILDYTKNKDAPGFAEWSKRGFEQPWVYYPLSQLLDNVYQKTGGPTHPLYSINQTLSFFKRFMTVNPIDSNFLFMSAVMLNTPMNEWVTDIFPSYIQTLSKSGEIGKKIRQGTYWHGIQEFEEDEYDTLVLAIKHGFTTFTYEQYMKSQWDKEEIGMYPEDMTYLERYYEYGASVLGINAALYQKFISKKMFGVIKKRYNQFLKMNMDKDTAMRRAVHLVSTTSFILDPNTWGAEGKWYTLGLFTRNITVGTLQTMTGAAWPVAKYTPLKGLYARPLGAEMNFHQVVQNIFHGSVSHADMDWLARYYLVHVGKLMGMATLLYGGLQYALSFLDDDEKDEHNEYGAGDPLAKKRFIWNNETGKRFQIRLPWRDINQRRLYLNPQFLREAVHYVTMFGDLGSESIPAGLTRWFRNRLNSPFEMMMNIFKNYDMNEPNGYIVDNRLPGKYQLQQISSYIWEELKPLGFFLRREERAMTGNKAVDIPLTLGESVGFNIRRGIAAEEGVDIANLVEERRKAAVRDFFHRQKNEDAQYMSPEQLVDLLGPDFNYRSYQYQYLKKRRPGLTELRRLKGGRMRYEAMGGESE